MLYTCFAAHFEIQSDESHHTLFPNAARTLWWDAGSAQDLPFWVYGVEWGEPLGVFPLDRLRRMQQGPLRQSYQLPVLYSVYSLPYLKKKEKRKKSVALDRVADKKIYFYFRCASSLREVADNWSSFFSLHFSFCSTQVDHVYVPKMNYLCHKDPIGISMRELTRISRPRSPLPENQ